MKKILIADNSDTCRTLAKRYLSNMGIDDEYIVENQNPQEILQLVKEDIFDVVILGTRFPEFSGTEIARQIKKDTNGNGPKIIAYTGDIQIDNEVFDKHILKPVEMQTFCESLYEVLMSKEKQS